MLAALSLALLFALGGEDRLADPVHEGKPLSGWLDDLRSPDVQVRRVAAARFPRLKPMPKTAVVALLRALQDSDSFVRAMAALNVATAADASTIAPALVEALKACDERGGIGPVSCTLSDHQHLAMALQLVGPGALPYLKTALGDEHRLVRAGAALALRDMEVWLAEGKPERRKLLAELTAEVPRLCRLLRDKDPYVRACAVTALQGLGHLAPATAVPALLDQVTSPEVQCEAVRALAYMGRDAAPAIPVFLKLLSDPDAVVNGSANEVAQSLAAIGADARQGVPALVQALRYEDWYSLQVAAAEGLRAYGPAAKDAVSALLEAARSSGTNLSREARRALLEIDPEAARRAGIE